MKALLTTVTLLFFAGLLYQTEKGVAKTGFQNRFKQVSGEIRTGDIILRNGKGFISEMFRKSSRNDQQFSHAGIIQKTEKGIFVVHVLSDSEMEGINIKREPIAEFCNSRENNGYAIYRYPFLTGKAIAINRYLNEQARQNIKFDEQFDLQTDSALYCTELVYKMCLNTAHHTLPLSDLNGRKYVGLDDLYFNSQAILITKQTY